MGISDATTTAVSGVALGAAGLLLGQLPEASPSWLTAGGLAVCISFTVWFGWYTTAVLIPRLVAQFREEAKEMRTAQERTVERVAAAFEKAIEKALTK